MAAADAHRRRRPARRLDERRTDPDRRARDAARHGARELRSRRGLIKPRACPERETERTNIILASTGRKRRATPGRRSCCRAATGRRRDRGCRPPLDAAIVLGDLARKRHEATDRRAVLRRGRPAPLEQPRTLAAAITQNVASTPGGSRRRWPARGLAFPLTFGEQGPRRVRGRPCSCRPPAKVGPLERRAVTAGTPRTVSRALLSAVDALDTAPDVTPSMETDLVLGARRCRPRYSGCGADTAAGAAGDRARHVSPRASAAAGGWALDAVGAAARCRS